MKKLLILGLMMAWSLLLAQKSSPIPHYLNNIGADAIETWDVMHPNSDVLLASAIELSAEQCPDGGFGEPHNDCSNTYYNIVPAIVGGIRSANKHFNNAGFVGVMKNAGDFVLTDIENGSPIFSTFTADMLFNLSQGTGDGSYRDWADVEFFQALQAGTYNQSDLDVAGYINDRFNTRPANRVNALAWDFSNLPMAAKKYCYPTIATAFEDALLDAINQLDNINDGSNGSYPNVYYDTEGLAGGILGLAQAKRIAIPAVAAPNYTELNGVTELTGLIDVLLQQQNPDGSFNWHSNLGSPSESSKDGQTTAIAVKALITASTTLGTDEYLPAIELSQKWLLTLQLPFGGFLSNPGSLSQYTSTEGKILQALATVPVTDRIYQSGLECYQE